MNTKKYTVRIRQEGIEKPTIKDFDSLDAARAFVRGQWGGADCIDSNISFHNDCATYDLVNFDLNDLGTFSYDDAGFREYRFHGDYSSTFHV